MKQEVSYSAMTADDIGSVLSIQAECNLSPWHEASYRAALKDPDFKLYTAKIENSTIGFTLMRLITSGFICEILNIGVLAQYRREKIGRGLLFHLLNNLDRPISRIWLEVREGNLPAIGFYQDQGFKVVGKRQNFYRDPVENALLMQKDLDQIACGQP